MLSLFRHVTRRPVAAVRPALAARYSTAPEPTSQPDVSAMGEVQQLLEHQAEEQQQRPFSLGGSSDLQFKETEKWKAFKPYRVVKPHDFTYKARFNAPPTYQTRRAQLGPRPSIARYNDVFHQFDIDPLDLSLEPDILSHFVSEMGKVYGRNITGLTSKSQRRLGKAIRRAKMMGTIPVLSRIPYGQPRAR